jgi:hypothetical protein
VRKYHTSALPIKKSLCTTYLLYGQWCLTGNLNTRKTDMSLHPGLNARIFRISRLRVTYTKFENFPPFSLLLFWKYKWSLVRIWNEINVGNKTKTFKKHLKISKILCLHYNLKKYRFYTGFSRAYFFTSLRVFFFHTRNTCMQQPLALIFQTLI